MKYHQDNDILRTFIIETKDHLETIELGVLKLEEEIGREISSSVDELFRAAHSIKAGANLLEFKKIEAIAHAIEDVLQSLRLGKLAVSADIVTLILQGVDMLSEMTENIQLSEMVKVDSIIKEFETLINE